MFNSKHAMNRHEFNSAMGYENDMVPCPCHNNNPDCPYCYGTGIFQMQPIEEENVAADKMVQRRSGPHAVVRDLIRMGRSPEPHSSAAAARQQAPRAHSVCYLD